IPAENAHSQFPADVRHRRLERSRRGDICLSNFGRSGLLTKLADLIAQPEKFNIVPGCLLGFTRRGGKLARRFVTLSRELFDLFRERTLLLLERLDLLPQCRSLVRFIDSRANGGRESAGD